MKDIQHLKETRKLGKRRKHVSMKKYFFLKSFFTNALLLLIPVFLISPYSIYQLNRESKNALKKNSYNILYQLDETMNSFMSELNSLYYYISSNLSVNTSLKAAYMEPSLSKNSRRSIDQICSLLRNRMYTNEYIETIYVYYYNDNDRILVPEKGMVSSNTYADTAWIESTKISEKDIWIDTDEVRKDKYSEPIEVINFYRKMYSTINPSEPVGVVVIEYNEAALNHYLDSVGLYENQTIAIVNKKNQILFQNNLIETASFFNWENNTAELGERQYYDIEKGNEHYTVSQMHSNYLNDLDYLSVVPTKKLMQSVNQFTRVFGLLIGITILVSVVLATFKTKKDYNRLERILRIFRHPELSVSNEISKRNVVLDPYSYITYNIINLFIQQDYLKVQTSEQKYRLKTLELTALQQQINPHFLHNTLNTIYFEAIGLTQGLNECSEMISKLASIMRYSLGNPDENVTIGEELNYLKNYIYIQNKRFKDKFDVEYDIDETTLSYPIRKIILQPLVENAIEHGIKENRKKGIIRIRIHRREKYIFVSVLDNGVGMKVDEINKMREYLTNTEEYNFHVGLYNDNRRLVLTYDYSARIHIQSRSEEGTCVFFRLPISAA